jgi:hypothetical protein
MNKPTTSQKQSIGVAPPKGHLGVLIPRMGAVAPTMPNSREPEHDLFIQHLMLTNMLRSLAEEGALDQSDLGENVEKLVVR